MCFVKPIKQEDVFGCSIACLSFVLKIKYKDILRLIENGKKRVAVNPDINCRNIVKILNMSEFGYSYKYVKHKTRKLIYEEYSIVFIKRSKSYPYGHYLVRSKNKWMDSWINIPNYPIKAGFRKRLPGIPIYVIFKQKKPHI